MIGSTPISGTICPVRSVVRTIDFHSINRGSIPLRGTIKYNNQHGEIPERPKGSDCKSDGSAFEGSNPSLTTTNTTRAFCTEECVDFFLIKEITN